MSTFLALRLLFITTIVCYVSNAGETSHPAVPLSRLEIRTNQSDLIAIVKVITVDYVSKAKQTKDGLEIVDLAIYGRLVRLQIIETYKSKLPQLPTPIYIFQLNSLEDRLLKTGEEYLLFLRKSAPPIIKGKIVTLPALPDDNYFYILDGRKGAVAKKDEKYSRIDAELRENINLQTLPSAVPPVK